MKNQPNYMKFLESGYAESQILYNLGNSYYRLNKLGLQYGLTEMLLSLVLEMKI